MLNWYSQLLACPVCSDALVVLDSCKTCGANFIMTDGLLSLVPHSSTKRYFEIRFSGSHSVVSDQRQAETIRYPKINPSSKMSHIYHLDPAHRNVLENLPAGSNILEIGCGGGQMRSWAKEQRHNYIGIDISKSRVSDALQAHGGPDILADAHFLPFKDNSFDAVYSIAVTEHLAAPHLVAQNIFKVLRPQGIYLGNCSFMEPWHDNSFYHMSPLGALELLDQAGFQVQYIWPGWSGFRAMMRMGNKITRVLSPIGNILNQSYKFGCWLSIRGHKLKGTKPVAPVISASRMTGAINWIAQKPAE